MQLLAKPFRKEVDGCEGPRAPTAPRSRQAGKRSRLGYRVLEVGCSLAENTSSHWHKTRDMEEAQQKQEHGGGWREGRTGSRQRKPVACPQFTRTGLLGWWRFVSQRNFTHVSVCVSNQYKQKATTRRKLINLKIWNREQVNKIHSKMWFIVWIPYTKSQHIILLLSLLKTLLTDKSSMDWISVLVTLNRKKIHLFTMERTVWRVEHAASF